MQTIHVVMTKEALDPGRLAGKIVVVLDILFATSSIVTALAHGAHGVVPVDGADAARGRALALGDGALLAGEWLAQTPPGFAPPTPLSLAAQGLGGRTVVYATTNGTVALARAHGAEQVYAAALLNASAMVRRLVSAHPERTILLVCSGSVGRVNLEDLYGAGRLVALLRQAPGERRFTDAALAAGLMSEAGDAAAVLRAARVGRGLVGRLDEELAFAARADVFDVVPRLIDGVLCVVD